MTSQQFERLEPFLADDETTIDGYSTPTAIGVLTDRQLISLRTGDEGRKTRVNATYLDRIGGVTLTRETAPDYHEDKLGYGVGAFVLALLSLALGVLVGGEDLTALLVVVSIGVGLLGVVLVLEAYDTPEDSVRIRLQTAEGDTAWQARLSEDYAEFAERVSRTVSAAHDAGSDVTRTVG